MKILIVYDRDAKHLFSSPSKHELIFCSSADALITFISERPSVVLVFAEYEADSFEEARKSLKDIKASNNGAKIFRVGFMPERSILGENYLRLPVSFLDESLDKMF